MNLVHQINEDGPIENGQIAPSELSLEHYYQRLSPSNAEQWRQDYINWIVHDDITFKQATSPWLRAVVINGGIHAAQWLPDTHSSARNWVLNSFMQSLFHL